MMHRAASRSEHAAIDVFQSPPKHAAAAIKHSSPKCNHQQQQQQQQHSRSHPVSPAASSPTAHMRAPARLIHNDDNAYVDSVCDTDEEDDGGIIMARVNDTARVQHDVTVPMALQTTMLDHADDNALTHETLTGIFSLPTHV
jgi:hypothetical protein